MRWFRQEKVTLYGLQKKIKGNMQLNFGRYLAKSHRLFPSTHQTAHLHDEQLHSIQLEVGSQFDFPARKQMRRYCRETESDCCCYL